MPRGWELVKVDEDNKTSIYKRRGKGTAWFDILEALRGSVADAVVFMDIDRLLRPTTDLVEIINTGARAQAGDDDLDLATADDDYKI